MTTRPRLVRSIPFWGLVAGSIATAGYGAMSLSETLATMTTTLTDGTATGVEVYVGQSQAVFGSVLVGAGIVGILLALTVASVATLRPHPPVEVVEPIDWDAEADTLTGDDAPEAVTTEAVAAGEPTQAR
jgi:hypothetical protein